MKSPPKSAINRPSKTSSSLKDVNRIFLQSKKHPQKKAKTKNKPKVYIFNAPKLNNTGNIVFSIIYHQ